MVALVGLFSAFTCNAQQSCVDQTRGTGTMHTEQVVLVNDSGEEVTVTALVADDGFERASGFQFICADVIDQTFILFKYQQPINGRFHMQNVRAPLDIAFFDHEGRLLQWMKMETYTETSRPLYGPDQPFQYALEARPGFFAANNILSTDSRMKMIK